MAKTYRIDSPVGPIGRWLPSIEAAKERYTMTTMEGWRFAGDDEPAPVITFEQSTEDEDSEPMPEYTRCLIDGRWDCSISVELPAWPSYESGRGASPALVMHCAAGPDSCHHEHLVCSDSCLPNEGRPEPRIRCATCGTTWGPC